MDSLTKLIEFSQISGNINILCQLKKEWFIQPNQGKGKRGQGIVHFVAEGQGYVQIMGETPRLLQTGDLIIFPRYAPHILSSEPECRNPHATPTQMHANGAFTLVQTAPESIESINSEKTAKHLTLFCVDFFYENDADLFHNLPESMFLHTQGTEFTHILSLLQHEAQSQAPASSYVVDALMRILLVLILRQYLNQNPQPKLLGILNGLQDKRLRVVLSSILAQPDGDWSVENMAKLACLSRSQLMRLFKQHIGMSPHHLVNHVRLQAAAVLLRKHSDSVLQIALSTGFQSETHFGKAFKKHFGITPSVYRKSDLSDLSNLSD